MAILMRLSPPYVAIEIASAGPRNDSWHHATAKPDTGLVRYRVSVQSGLRDFPAFLGQGERSQGSDLVDELGNHLRELVAF